MTDDKPALPAGAATSEAKPKRWPKVLLAGSLTLNLLVLGMVAGAQFRDGRDQRLAPPPNRTALHDSGLAPFFDAMPREARGRLSQAIRGRGQPLGPNRATLAQELRGMIAVLKAERYDAQAMAGLMTAQQQRAADRAATGRDILLEQIGAMSAQERATFADELERRFNRALSMQPPPPMAPPRPNN
jgi:uncharacterized membrane protein